MFEAKDFLDLETLCRELDASESSVRRDLDVLEAESVLKRVYGGAVPVHAVRQRRRSTSPWRAGASATRRAASRGLPPA